MIQPADLQGSNFNWEKVAFGLMSHVQEGVILFNEQLHIRHCNEAMIDLLGKTIDQVLGSHIAELFPLPNEAFIRTTHPATSEIIIDNKTIQLTIIPSTSADESWSGGTIVARRSGRREEPMVSREKSHTQEPEQLSIETLINTSLNGIVTIDSAFRYTAWNPVIEQMTGLSREDVLGKSVFEVFHGTEETEGGQAFVKALQGERVYLRGKTYPQATGVYDSFAVPIYNKRREIVGAMAVFYDVTDRKKAEERLQESLHLIEQIADAAPGILYLYDLSNGYIAFVNDELTDVLGFTVEEMEQMGKNGLELIVHPDDLPAYLQLLQRFTHLHPAKVLEQEYRIKDIHGDWHWMLVRNAVFKRAPDGTPAQIIAIAQDITERKRIEEELQHKNMIIEGMLTHLPIIVIRIDREGHIIESLGMGLRRLGQNDNEVVGRNVFESDPQVAEHIQQVLQGRASSFIGAWEYGGEKKFFLNHFFPDAASECAIGFSIDITDEKEVENSLRQREDELRKLNQELELRITERTRNLEEANCQLRQEIAERQLIQEALRSSEERYELAAKATHDAIWDWNLMTDELTFYENYYTIFGYNREDVDPLINECYKNIHPDDKERVSDSIRKVVRNEGRFWKDEYRYRRKDGTYAYVIDRGYVQRNADGIPFRMVGAMQDITARKQAEEALRRSEAHYRFLAEAIPAIIWTTDMYGQVDYYNKQWIEYTGLTLEQVKQEGWITLLHPDDQAVTLQAWEKALQTGAKYAIEQRIRRKDGQYRWFMIWALPYRDENNSITRWLGSAIDIDDRKRANALVRQNEERFRLVALATNDAIYDLDLISGKGWWNEVGRRIMGFKSAEIDHAYEIWTENLAPSIKEEVKISFRQAIEQGKDQWVYEYPFRKSDGAYAYVRDRCQIMRDERGKAVRIVGSMADLTDLKQTQQELEQYTQKLKRSNEELEQFAYIASHDLQEPLRTITGFVRILRKRLVGNVNAEVDEMMHFVMEGADRMALLIRNLLEYSRIGTSEIKRKPVDCNDIIQLVIGSMQTAITENGVDITYETLPTLLADKTQMMQLFQNLLGNAIKFRSEKPAVIRIAAQEQATHWQFSFQDNGIGMDMIHSQRIFQVFQRLHTRDQYEGTGIGLATCKKIVERHGGAIWVESMPGQGATFYFTIQK